jgi:hypothetical protein
MTRKYTKPRAAELIGRVKSLRPWAEAFNREGQAVNPMTPGDIQGAIQEELADYLAGRQSLKEFASWFVPETWDIHLWAPRPVQEMVYGVKLLLDEYTSGAWSEDELKAKLAGVKTP